MGHPCPLVSSTRPPVSVCGTGPRGRFSRGRLRRALPAARGRRVLSPSGLQRALPSARGAHAAPSLPARGGYGNVRPFPIGSPLRVRLRPRLTPGRLALPGKPWPSGVRGSRPHYRYSCLHLLFRKLRQPSRAAFTAAGMLPYPAPRGAATASAARLMPAHYRRPAARPVSCYALFECMAASKPTSWLSLRPDRL